jgi:hypothetical protein
MSLAFWDRKIAFVVVLPLQMALLLAEEIVRLVTRAVVFEVIWVDAAASLADLGRLLYGMDSPLDCPGGGVERRRMASRSARVGCSFLDVVKLQ